MKREYVKIFMSNMVDKAPVKMRDDLRPAAMRLWELRLPLVYPYPQEAATRRLLEAATEPLRR